MLLSMDSIPLIMCFRQYFGAKHAHLFWPNLKSSQHLLWIQISFASMRTTNEMNHIKIIRFFVHGRKSQFGCNSLNIIAASQSASQPLSHSVSLFSRTIDFDCQLCNPISLNKCMFVMSLSIYINIFFVLSLSVIVCCVGPAFWGLINPQWNMCSKGRRQSPIDIEPDKLLFDPYLRPLHIDKHKVNPINYFKNAYSTTVKCCTKKRKRAQIQEHRHTHIDFLHTA